MGRARKKLKLIQAPFPEMWSETIPAVRRSWRRSGVACFGLPPLENYRRRDRDLLVPSRRMDAAVCRAEVCYPWLNDPILRVAIC